MVHYFVYTHKYLRMLIVLLCPVNQGEPDSMDIERTIPVQF